MFVFRQGRFGLIFLNRLPVFFQETRNVGGGDAEGSEAGFEGQRALNWAETTDLFHKRVPGPPGCQSWV